MADNTFGNLRLDDARITKVMLDGATVSVSIRDWQGTTVLIDFADVIGIEAFAATNVDLGGVNESSADPLIEKACSIVEEPTAGFHCYSFVSAWNDQPVFRIVGRSWSVRNAVT